MICYLFCFLILLFPQIYTMDQKRLWCIVHPDRCAISQSSSEPESSKQSIVFSALSNGCKKTESHNDSDIKKYNGPLLSEHENYKPEEIASVRVNPKKCLFMGNYNSIEQGCDNKVIRKIKRFDQHAVDTFLTIGSDDTDAKKDAIDQDADIFFNQENNAEQINVLKDLQQQNTSISAFAMSNNGLIAVVGFNCHKNNLFLFNKDGKVISLEGHVNPVTQIRFNNKGT